jgi:adenine phosphoribosyltransferase
MKSYREALSLIRLIPDFPKAGILFQDITPVLADGQALHSVVDELTRRATDIDVVAGVEARGFILGAAIAHQLHVGFIPIRKSGKLPFDSISKTYGLEYGESTLEMHQDCLKAGARVFLIDDILATGGTLIASIQLIEELGGIVTDIGLLTEIPGLNGYELIAEQYPSIRMHLLNR